MGKVEEKIINFIRDNGGYVRWKDLGKAGFDSSWVYVLRDKGKLERVGHGLYRLLDHPINAHMSFVEIARQIPKGIICLRSALSYYEFTTYNPPLVDVALPYGAYHTKRSYPPIKLWVFSKRSYSVGVEDISIDGAMIRIYGREKTICDCFKFRNKIGVDLAKEGLREYLKIKDRNIQKLIEFSRVCRVETILRTYMDAML